MMDMNPEIDRALAKVKKMITLANDAGATEGERDNALRMAHALLAKHNLSMAQAEAHGSKTEEGRVKDSVTTRNRPWRRQIANSIADLLFCYCYFQRSGNTLRLYMIGRQSNVTTALELTQYVIESVAREGKARQRTEGHPASWYTSFVKGATRRIYERCAELRAAAERASVPAPAASRSTALVLASVYQQEHERNKVFLAAEGVQLRTVENRERNTGYAGYAEGRQYGDGVSLTRQLKDQQVKGALK